MTGSTATCNICSDTGVGDTLEEAAVSIEPPLSLSERFPVLYQVTGATVGAGPAQKSRRVGKPVGKAKLLPGEKAKLKRERRLKARVSRLSARGLDLVRVNSELREFVLAHGDMKAFGPLEARSNRLIQSLASHYGLKSSQQGSGKKAFVVVTATQTTSLPQGEREAKIAALLQFHEDAIRQHSESSRKKAKKGKRAIPTPPKPEGARKYQRPVGFVSGGAVDPDNPHKQSSSAEDDSEDSSEDGGEFGALSLLDELAESEEDLDLVAQLMRRRPAPGLGYEPQMEPEDLTMSESNPEAHLAASCSGGPEEDLQPPARSGVSSSSGSDDELASEAALQMLQLERSGPSAPVFWTKKEKKRAEKKQEKLARRGERQQVQEAAVQQNLVFGAFEKYTTGFGSRMLKEWGFAGEGSGLGSSAQGISEPVEAYIRPKKLGLGAG